MDLTLASRSPQRRAILAQLGVPYTVAVPEVEELETGEPRALVLEVDTTVALAGASYGKPRDPGEAEATLRALSGRDHEVWSGIALRDARSTRMGAARTRVRFR